MRWRTVWPWLLVVVALVLVAVVAGAPTTEDGRAYDPDGTGDRGVKALRLLLGEFGADVSVTDDLADLPDPGAGGRPVVAVLFDDRYGDVARLDVERWVEAGGTLVVTDPYSPFTPPIEGGGDVFGGLTATEVERGRCDEPALAGLDRLETGDLGVRYEVAPGSRSCFGDEASAFVVVSEVGDGNLVAVGGGTVFTNADLDEADAAGLAVALMAPEPGGRVVLLQPPAVGPDGAATDRDLFDALPGGARLAMAQLLVAFVVYAASRARRLGRPVPEEQPVAIAGSELVLAVGNLLQRTRSPARAAAVLSDDLRRHLAERLGLPPTAPPAVVADVAAARSAVPRDRVLAVLAPPPVRTDADLLDLAQAVETIREEVLHV
jgi:hypothetical protein